MKKAIFFDIDGTLIECFGGIVDMSEKVKNAIYSLQKKGHYVFIATVRPYAFLSQAILDFGFDGFILANGAQVILNNEIIHSEYIDKGFLNDLVEEFEELNIQYILQDKKYSYLKEEFKEFYNFFESVNVSTNLFIRDYVFEDINAYKIEMLCPNEEVANTCLEIVKRNEDYDYVSSIDAKSFELYSKKNTKATAILKVLEHLDIDIKNSYAFGDGKNDIEMLSTVGCGIAMGNASDEVKKYAKEITDTVFNDGVAVGIEKFIL